MDGFFVIKRDRSKEPFDHQKITRVVRAAGLAKDEAEKLATRIAGWVIAHQKKEVTSLIIRDRILEELQKINSFAAGLFEWYQKTKS